LKIILDYFQIYYHSTDYSRYLPLKYIEIRNQLIKLKILIFFYYLDNFFFYLMKIELTQECIKDNIICIRLIISAALSIILMIFAIISMIRIYKINNKFTYE
jgi:hypothetical protein